MPGALTIRRNNRADLLRSRGTDNSPARFPPIAVALS